MGKVLVYIAFRVELLQSFKFTGKTVKIRNLPIITGKIGKYEKNYPGSSQPLRHIPVM